MDRRALAACVLLLAGRAHAAPELSSVRIEGVPHIAQRPDFCGEACAAMWLGKLGHRGDQDWVFDQAGLDPALGRGVHAAELARALTRIGFRIGPGWFHQPYGDRAAVAARFGELHDDLRRGVPSIVCMRYDATPRAGEHFRLVLGYDAARDEVIYHEPAVAGGAYQRMARAAFLDLWPLVDGDGGWMTIRFALAGPAVLPGDRRKSGFTGREDARAGFSPGAPTAADYAQHVLALRERLPAGFDLVVSPPFVVIGDGGPEAVRRSAEHTVAWAVARLKESFFARDPDEILDVWLFKDGESYRRNALAFFGDKPSTPYGYYSSAHHALVMNIATGGGTLVHEIVHPYVAANFPGARAWLNEGLGSLFEQSAEVDGRIVGLTNWRLAGLKDAIRAGRLPTFAAFTAMSDEAFYASPDGYAQARYLLYYLQEHGLLGDFYQRYLAARAEDPSGYRTLTAILGEPDMAAFQRRWAEWVLGLVFGPG